MIRHLSIGQILDLHEESIEQHGGLPGLRDEGMLESAVGQTSGQFAGVDYYPSLEEKAAALTFSLVRNHPFNDGNKRTGLLSLLLFLYSNGYDLPRDDDGMEDAILRLAAGRMAREELADWIRNRMVPLKQYSNS